MKKILSFILSAAAVLTLASCSGNDADTNADSAAATDTQASEQTTEEDTDDTTANVSAKDLLSVLTAMVENAPESIVYDNAEKPLSAINFISCFGGEVEFDDNFEPIYPAVMNKVEEYAFCMPTGKSPIEIDVFKVKEGEDVKDIQTLCADRIQKIKDSDIKVYDQEGICDKVFPLMTVYTSGRYVIMISVENPEEVKLTADALLMQEQ